MTTIKVTPAMRGWLQHLARGESITRSAGKYVGPYYANGRGGLTYVMANKLEDAGLIKWEPGSSIGVLQREAAILTDAGRAAAKGGRHAK